MILPATIGIGGAVAIILLERFGYLKSVQPTEENTDTTIKTTPKAEAPPSEEEILKYQKRKERVDQAATYLKENLTTRHYCLFVTIFVFVTFSVIFLATVLLLTFMRKRTL